MAAERLFELRRTKFDTPHFRGIEFIEVEAKSIINHVPGNYLPFNWTINPYRGCSHACTYCVSGDTPILMGDGSTRAIGDVQVGDEVYGTVRRGSYRRYEITSVLDHWATVKPAYRVTLEDGTELIASGDHRFLSRRGWKYVTGAEHGPLQRPHLTVNNKLMGTGKFAAGPIDGAEYRRGYLCGIIRGDGHLGSYTYARPSGVRGEVHSFRLALIDIEPLQRVRDYLKDIGIATQVSVFQEAVGNRKTVDAIRTGVRSSVNVIKEVVRWPDEASEEWCKGFLAGIFDAEGSHGGSIRIANTDDAIVDQTCSCLRRLRFGFVIEETRRRNGLRSVRLVGGLPEKLRFFHTVDPSITRKRSIEGIAIKSNAPLRVASIEPLGIELPMFDITTGTGDFIANGVVSHNCFARSTHLYMEMNAGRDFETKIVVKVNAPRLLRKELRAKRWTGEPIAMGTATDPYQRAEGKYRLMRGIIEGLTEVGNPFSILTKGTLILRDLDLLVAASEVTDVSTALSVGTVDADVWRKSEPGTPHPRKRLEAVTRLNEAGIPCGVMIAPILPGISDSEEQLRAVVSAALDAGATHVSPILLHLRPGVKEVYLEWLEQTYPDLVSRYRAMYPGAYAARGDRNDLSQRVGGIIQSLEPKRSRPAGPSRRRFDPPANGASRARRERAVIDTEQLKLL